MLLQKVERFLRQTDMPAARFGREAVNDPCFVFDLRAGREPRSATVRRVLAYLDAYRADAIEATQSSRLPHAEHRSCGARRYARLFSAAPCPLVDHG